MSEGDMTVGNYQLKNCVASGSTTQIWECNEAGSPMQLAMKLMLEDARKISAEKNVLKHEYKVGSSLDHPSFLRFHDIEINRDHAFFVMDFFRSPSLKTHITSGLTPVQSCFPKLAESLAQAYNYMHDSGWLHRDIKPDNILVNKAGEVRVIDFNLTSRVKGSLGLMLSGKQKAIQGTRTYIAPETILKKAPTQQTDIYSLGVTFFEVLTGQPPFAGDTPNALLKKHLGEDAPAPSFINPNVTKDLDKIILRMLEKNPKKRFESMQEIASAIRQIKCFEEDPVAMKERLLQEEKERHAQSVDTRLDSRADADRTSRGIKAPVAPKRKVRRSVGLEREEAAQKAKDVKKQQAGGGQQMPGMPMPQQPMPMQPGMGYPGMPMQPAMGYPGMPMPQMPMPQMPPPMMPQGQPMHNQPMHAPPQQQPVPQQPPQQPAVQQPAVPQQQPVPHQQPSGPPPQQGQQPGQPQTQPPAPQQPAPPPAQQPAPPAAVPPAEEPQEMTLEDMMDINIE